MTSKDKDIHEIELLLKEAYERRGIDLAECKTKVKEALARSRALDQKDLIGRSLNTLALFCMISGKNETAITLSEEAITFFEKEKNDLGVANAKYNLAGVLYKTYNYHLGMFYLLESLATYRIHGDKHSESKTQKSLGSIYEFMGDRHNAVRAYEEAILCAKEVNDDNLESNAYNPLSGILLKLGNTKEAMRLASKSMALKIKTGDRRGFAFAIYGRGKVHLSLKKYDAALSDFKEALAIHKEVPDVFGMAMCYNKIALLHKVSGNTETAKAHIEKTVEFSIKHNLSLFQYKSYFILSQLYKELKQYKKSLEYLELHNKVKDESVNSQTLKVIKNYERIAALREKENKAVIERERALIVLEQQRVEEESKVRQNFLSAMSHEIRTPLNAITTIISLLKDQHKDEDQKLLNSLQFSARNLMLIINDILDFSKLDSNKMKLDKHPTNVSSLLENIKETYAGMAQEKGLSLQLKSTGLLANAYSVDETKMFQILGNLVSNAIKYTSKGAVHIEVELLRTSEKEHTLRLGVRDTGRGIPLIERERLFESFYIPQSLTTRNDGGTGLGLAIVKKLVLMHDSNIHLESEVGKGSYFYFDIDLSPANFHKQSKQELSETLRGKKLILAEDNEINALVMGKLLDKWGIIYMRAKNGEEAIQLARQEHVDFILMDIHMPIINGYEATKTIRTTQNVNTATPIIALTADITAANTSKYYNLFDGFLWKPIEIDRLFDTLNKSYITSSLSL